MLSIEKCRKIDPALSDLSDEELLRVRGDLYEMAQLAFKDWTSKKGGSKNPTWVLSKNNTDVG